MEAIDFLKETHDESLYWCEQLRFDKEHPWHRNLIALLGSMIELSGALCALSDKRAYAAVKPIFRSFLETFVEFKNLSGDRKYGYHMEASYIDQWNKVLKAAVKQDNPYLTKIGELPHIEVEIETNSRELKKLRNDGYQTLNVYEKFQRAGMESEYRSMYNFLSNESHSNIRALINRHFEFDDDGGNLEVVFYKDWEKDEFDHYYLHAARLLLIASLSLHKILESNCEEAIEERIEELDEFERALYA